jgi:hypothetical protein
MGYYGTKIGQYWMSFHDSEVVRLKQHSYARDYYKMKKIEIEFGDDSKDFGKFEKLKISVSKIFTIKKVKTEKGEQYAFDWKGFDLRKTLWNELIKRKIDIYLNPYVLALTPDRKKIDESKEYYLESPMLDNRILLSNEKPEPILIQGYASMEWLDKHCLSY